MKPSILIVDDNAHLLRSLGDFFAFHNFDVRTAQSGEEALNLLSGKPCDIIVLDIGMPGMGGIGFLNQLSRKGAPDQIPVLVLTGRVLMKDFFDSTDVDGFLSKPCNQMDILRKVREILTQRRTLAVEGAKPHRIVLLVEDDFTVIEEIQNAFRSGPRRLTLELATTAADALEKATTLHPDLIMTTEVLRGMNGDEMAALLRHMPRANAVPVILYDKTHLFEGVRALRYRAYGRVSRFMGAADGRSLYQAACELLDG